MADKKTLVNITQRPWTYSDVEFWFNPKDKCQNAIIEFDGKRTRLRAGVLIVKDDTVLLCEDPDTPGDFSLPGGGLDKDETILEAGKREAQEEVCINLKKVQDTEYDYCECHTEIMPWVKKNIIASRQWYNYYTCLIIGEYESDYLGKIDKVDLDPQVKGTSRWYKISEVINLPSFKKQWKKALIDYGYYVSPSIITEDLTSEAKKYFGTVPLYQSKVGFYINVDGTILDGSGELLGNRNGRMYGQRTIDHRAIAEIMTDISGDNAMLAYMKEGNIRLMPESPGISLIKEPTSDQIRTLNRIISSWRPEEFYVDVVNDRGDNVKSFSYEYPLASQIIGDLYDYFDKRLNEDTRSQLISKSRSAGQYKDQSRGKNRFERKKYSKIANYVKQYNNINMDDFFKKDILLVKIPVTGETNNYTVSIKIEGVCAEIAKNIKNNNNKLEFRTIVQSLTNVFNTGNVYVNCTCLAGNTLIPQLDGTSITVEEMYKSYNSGKQLFVYSVDENGDFKPGVVEKVLKTGKTTSYIEVTLDNNETIRTTADHLYMLRNGTYAQAQDLKVGQSLMPLYFDKTKNNYDTVKFNSTGHYHSVYKEVGNYFYKNEIEAKKQQAQEERQNGKNPMSYDVAIHHIDFNKANNDPNNLIPLTGYEHWMLHANTINRLWQDPQFVENTKARSREWMTWLNKHPTEKMTAARHDPAKLEKFLAHNSDPEWLAKQSKLMSTVINNYYANLSEEEKQKLSKQRTNQFKKAWADGKFNTEKFKKARQEASKLLQTPENKAKAKAAIKEYWTNLSEEERQQISERRKEAASKCVGWNKGKHLSEEDKKRKSEAAYNTAPAVKAARAKITVEKKIYSILKYMADNNIMFTEDNYECLRSDTTKFKFYPHINKRFKDISEAVAFFKLNHKIIKIQKITLEEAEPVYDIVVKDWHNFLVSAGVILHNCSDFKFSFSHWTILNHQSTEDSSKDPGPGKGIRNPNNDKGIGCKHILLVLANLSWVMKVSSVINNYIHYAETHMQKPFLKIIFPKLYGIPADEMVEEDLIDDEKYLDSSAGLIDAINEYGRKRGWYKKGSNKNPVAEKEKLKQNQSASKNKETHDASK